MRHPVKRAALPPAPAVVIRDARPADRARLERWHRGLGVLLAPLLPELTRSDLPSSYGKLYLAHTLRLQRKQGGFVLLAEREGRPVGFLTGLLQSVPGPVARMELWPSQEGFVMDVFVEEGARGEGVGRALFDAAERRFVEMGCDNVQLNVIATNEGARRFYARRGYTDVGLRMRKTVARRPISWDAARGRRREGRRRSRRWRPLRG